MPKDNVTSFIRKHNVYRHYSYAFTADGYARLRTYLGMIRKGQSKVYTAPFAAGQPITKVMEDWMNVLESKLGQWPTLLDFEKDLANKVGPMSVELPVAERLADIKHYYEDILLPQTPIDPRAVNAVIDEWRKVGPLHLRSQRDTLWKMKKSTSSGSPWMTKKRNVVQDITPCSVVTLQGRHPDVIAQIQGKSWDQTAILGWRGQEGGPSAKDTKQRVVWMFPFAVNLSELQVYQPLIEMAQQYNIVPAWVSNDRVDDHITRLFDSKGKDDLVVCTDFSKFDQHFNSVMQDGARQVLASLLADEATSHKWLGDVFPVKYVIPMAWDYDKAASSVCYFVGPHGMGSGSGGTNADETIAHRALQHEVAILHNQALNPYSMCLGDDGILSYPGITVEDVVAAYTKHGQECNTSKQYASTQDCVFLRRWHHTDYRVNQKCVGVYSTCRAIGRLRYLERFMDPDVWSREMVAMRQISILENCKYHPLFHEFLNFCMKRDKYRLGIDIPGFLEHISDYAKEATDYMPDFLGYTKTLQGQGYSGIQTWDTVQYLKSFR